MVSGKCRETLTKTQKINNIQSSKGKKPKQQHLHSIQTTTMTKKKQALIEAICDAFGIDYPEVGPDGDGETIEEAYENKLKEYNFTSGCYVNHEFLSLAKIVEIAEDAYLLDDDF